MKKLLKFYINLQQLNVEKLRKKKNTYFDLANFYDDHEDKVMYYTCKGKMYLLKARIETLRISIKNLWKLL